MEEGDVSFVGKGDLCWDGSFSPGSQRRLAAHDEYLPLTGCVASGPDEVSQLASPHTRRPTPAAPHPFRDSEGVVALLQGDNTDERCRGTELGRSVVEANENAFELIERTIE